MAYGMDFAFLYDPEIRLFAIGYNLSLGRIDANHYDLLATEARLAGFFAIAKHDAPTEHWFAFSRPITRLPAKVRSTAERPPTSVPGRPVVRRWRRPPT